MATIKEVAQRAQVSVATVSRVINDSGYVSPDLRGRVHKAMADLHYQPSALARSLRRQETLSVGIIIPQLDNPFFSALVFAAEQSLFAQKYRTLICSVEENIEKENAYVDMLLRQRVDGVLFVPTDSSSANLKRLQEQIPTVVVDRDLPFAQVDKVLSNNFKGGYDGMTYLLQNGHRRIAVIGTQSYSRAMMTRIEGVQSALEDFHIKLQPEWLTTGRLQQFEMGYTTACKLLNTDDRPTAIFALTDVIAIGVMHAAAEINLHLPDDLSILGFDGIPITRYMIPSLTTIAQPIYQMGQEATRILLSRIRQPDKPFEVVELESELKYRKSVTTLK